MSTQPIDYDALARKAGAVSATGGAIDYDALAKKAGAVSSSPAAEPPPSKSFGQQILDVPSGFVDNLAATGEGMVQSVAHPIETVKGLAAAQGGALDKAKAAFKAGNYLEAARYAIGYALPVIGPQINNLGDESGRGDVGHALGGAASLGMQLAAPGALAKPGVVNAAATAPSAINGAVRGAIRGTGEVLSNPTSLMQGGVGEMAAHAVGIPPGVTAAAVALPKILRSSIAEARAAVAGHAARQLSSSLVPSSLWEAPEAPASVPYAKAPPAAARVPVRAPVSSEAVAPRFVPEPVATPAAVKPPVIEEPPYIPPTLEQKLAGLSPRIREQILAKMRGEAPPPAAAPTEPAPAAARPVPRVSPEAQAAPEAYTNTQTTGLQVPQITSARGAIAEKMAQHFYDYGISSDALNALDADAKVSRQFWDQTGQIPGVSKQSNYRPSGETIDAVRDRLADLERAKTPRNTPTEAPSIPAEPTALANNPQARAIAEQLQAEMAKSEAPPAASNGSTKVKVPPAGAMPDALSSLVTPAQWEALPKAIRNSVSKAIEAGDMKTAGKLLNGPGKVKK